MGWDRSTASDSMVLQPPDIVFVDERIWRGGGEDGGDGLDRRARAGGRDAGRMTLCEPCGCGSRSAPRGSCGELWSFRLGVSVRAET